jgi:tetratricopeptide (TPR) repeat protein
MRATYAAVCLPGNSTYNPAEFPRILAAARNDESLTRRERDEVELIDAKIDMRLGDESNPEPWNRALAKLKAFLKTARSPEYRSEARGWIAHIYYRLGKQTAAGKIYLDELNRPGSNLSYETLVNSLRMTYGYDGGPGLVEHLEEYFDSPEHAAFAIHLATNPHWDRYQDRQGSQPLITQSPPYTKLKNLLEKHAGLFATEKGAATLATLGMRVALNAGDPHAAIHLASKVPNNATVRTDPNFQWMLASAYFLSRDYAAAETPLLALYESNRASPDERAAAAYGLCGVYEKLGTQIEQIRFALALRALKKPNDRQYGPWSLSYASGIADKSVYWAISGWDLSMLLDAEASIDTLRRFVETYPNVPEVEIVRYSLAVRLARENRYEEAAEIYESLNASKRAQRMRRLAVLWNEAATGADRLTAKYTMAQFLAANASRVYFNDRLWYGMQRYAFFASRDSRLTRSERETLIIAERKLKDDQEERWRAYQMLREVIRDAGRTDLGMRSAALAINCLRRISDRFEREDERRNADIELSGWLAGTRKLRG